MKSFHSQTRNTQSKYEQLQINKWKGQRDTQMHAHAHTHTDIIKRIQHKQNIIGTEMHIGIIHTNAASQNKCEGG